MSVLAALSDVAVGRSDVSERSNLGSDIVWRGSASAN